MNSRESRPRVMDAYYKSREGLIRKVERYYRRKSDEELKWIKAELTRREKMLGNIPLLASTTPIVFLIFGSQLNKYFPHDGWEWLMAVTLSVSVIVWSINHHFRCKGRVGLDLFLVDEILKERSQTGTTPVK
ncbi:MAG TPA: hypothetical protein VFV52_12510 [Bacilli bacterium]|nr:hypothetical protein [Bacilli bacterium]